MELEWRNSGRQIQLVLRQHDVQLFMQNGAGPIITGSVVNDRFDGVFDSLNAVYYPSIRKFTDILESQFYLELHRHKVLCDALVVLSTPLTN